jgi:DNA-binding IclR family transcriptional regulator
LQESHHETALLIIPIGDQRLVLKESRSDQQIALSHGEGSTIPLLVGSAGRVLLSQYDDRTLQHLFAVMDIPSVVPGFMTDPDLRMEEIKAIRSRGYALSTGEMIPDSTGISVPIKGYVCPVALSIFGPKFRFNPLDALDDIQKSARRISARIKPLFTETGFVNTIKSRKDQK